MRGYRFCLIKAYFDKGLNLTNYVKYLIFFFGLSSQDVSSTMILGTAYIIFCFFLGFFWYKTNMVEAEIEVNNRYNLFVKEMRQLSGSERFK